MHVFTITFPLFLDFDTSLDFPVCFGEHALQFIKVHTFREFFQEVRFL